MRRSRGRRDYCSRASASLIRFREWLREYPKCRRTASVGNRGFSSAMRATSSRRSGVIACRVRFRRPRARLAQLRCNRDPTVARGPRLRGSSAGGGIEGQELPHVLRGAGSGAVHARVSLASTITGGLVNPSHPRCDSEAEMLRESDESENLCDPVAAIAPGRPRRGFAQALSLPRLARTRPSR